MTDSVKLKLLDELRVRNKQLLIPHLYLVIQSALIFFKLHGEEHSSLIPYVIILLGLCARYFVMRNFFTEIKAGKRLPSLLYLISVSLTGISWGFLLFNVYNFYGLFSVQTIYCLGAILILMSGGVTAFSSSIKTATIYLISLVIFPVYIFFIDPEASSYILGILFLVNCVYQFYHILVSFKQIKRTLINESIAVSQKIYLQEFIDALPGLVLALDDENTYVMVNKFQDGFFKEKFLGKKVGAVYPESEFPKAVMDFVNSDLMESVKEIKSNVYSGENWWLLTLRKVLFPQRGVIIAAMPITETVKARNDLKIQEARSQYAAKLASLGEMSASIAHEVNNPLTIIEGAANLMKVLVDESPPDVSALQKTSNKIIETTQRIGRIIKSLRMLSGDAEEEPFRNITFASIVEPTLEICKLRVKEHNIKLSVFQKESEVELFGNETQLSQVIMNLVTNAIDAVKATSKDKWIEIHYIPSFEWLDILVVDNGEGVDPELREKIMEPFFSTKDSHHGTGLGLSISNSIIENHHGTLSLLEGVDNTTFRMRFPRMTLKQT
jgi:signal transduction histidine kinase